jgi:hypothetical protein
LRSDTSARSQQKKATNVVSSRSRAVLVGTLARESQPRIVSASHAAAFGASQGASTGTFFAIESRRAMAWPALRRAAGLIRGTSPR